MKYQIQHQNSTSFQALDEMEKHLCDHDYATFYDSRDDAGIEIMEARKAFANPDELSIIEVVQNDE